jgi:CAAX protease family protein
MTDDLQPVPEFPPTIPGPPTEPHAPQRPQLIAPLWHTILFIAILLANSYIAAISLPKMSAAASAKQLVFGYVFTIGWELVLLLVVWLGIRSRGVTIRSLISGRWKSVEDFLIDVALAAGGVVTIYIVVGIVSILMGLADPQRIGETKKLADMLAPSSPAALAVFILLSSFAGFIEEIVFRGYFQKQFAALTGKVYLGMIIQAVIFGLGHGYEGFRRMFVIFCLGCLFGILALVRKSLRPGMMAHAVFDSLQGVILYLLKKGLIRLP